MFRSSSTNPAKIKNAIKSLIKRPDMKAPQVMKLIGFSNEEVANLSLHRFFQQSLPGKTMKGLKALLLGLFLHHQRHLIEPCSYAIMPLMSQACAPRKVLLPLA
jgi:hypothetical protein